MSEKMIVLPPTFDVDSYLKNRVNDPDMQERIANNLGNFAGFGGATSPSPNGQFAFNPFGLPGSANFPGSQMLSNANTIFNNLRWYFISNFRQVLSEAYVELGLVQTIVDVPVDDAFRGGIEIKTKQLSPEQVEQLQISLDRDDDLQTVAQTAKWNRLFGGAGTLILTDQDPREPLDLQAITKDSPLEFRAVDLWELFWDKQNTEGYDPQLQAQEFSYYNYYGEIVHKSRVLRMKGMTAPSFVRPRLRGWGFSVVEILVRSINQYLKATDLAFEVLDEFKVDVYQIKNLVNTLLSPQGANKVKQRIAVANQLKNFQNAIVLDSEDQYEQKMLNFSGIAEIMGQIRMQVAADMRMPMTKLFGISAAGFNSGEDDIEVYNSMVESQVRNKVKYQVLRLLEVKCQKMFGMIPDDLSVTFKPLRVLSAVDEESVKTSKFNRLAQAVQTNQITPEQFVDACNKGQLFDILLEKPIQLNPPAGYDTAAEDEFLDPLDPKSESDPGTNRHDTRYPLADEIGGMPKGLEKSSGKHAPPASGDEKEARDRVKQPGKDHPFGDQDDADLAATKEDDPTLDEPQREGDPEWLDEDLPEDVEAQHKLKLDKPKRTEGDAPDAREGESTKEPGTAAAKKPKKTTPPEPMGHPEKRRINNAKDEAYWKALDKKMRGVLCAWKSPSGKVFTSSAHDFSHYSAWQKGNPNLDMEDYPGSAPSSKGFGFVLRDGTFITRDKADQLLRDLEDHGYGTPDFTNSRSQRAIDARTKVGQPGIKLNGRYEEILADQRKLEGVKPAVRAKKTGKIFVGQGIESHTDIKLRVVGPKFVDRVNKWEDYQSGFVDKTGKFLTRDQADRKFGFGMSESLLERQGLLKNVAGKDQFPKMHTPTVRKGHQFVDDEFCQFEVDDADLTKNPSVFFQTPDDRSVEARKQDDDDFYFVGDAQQKVPKVKRCVAVAVISGKNEFILTGRRRDTALWTSPGGHAMEGESLRDAACRELYEETGLQVQPQDLTPLTQRTFTYPDHSTLVQVFAVKLRDRVSAKTTQDPDNEVDLWRWVPLSPKSVELKSWNRQADNDLVTEYFKI